MQPKVTIDKNLVNPGILNSSWDTADAYHEALD